MDLSESLNFSAPTVERHFRRGLAAFGSPVPQSLSEWAIDHFYLSAESSYVEQAWTPWPFQLAIMACMSNDDIAEVTFKKSARVGYTKMLLAFIGYTAHHRRRNQCVWQPTDDDRDEFVKTELEPMLRDVRCMRDVFPAYMARHKDNTLHQKKFLGSVCHTKGAKAAKNFRRMSLDNALLDEVDACDADIEKEGDIYTLAGKRLEGATFPKMISGSTPKLKGFSLIDAREAQADARFDYHIPCPHCGELHPLTWGGKDEPHGFKWTDGDHNSARHLCPHCATLITQSEYLAVWEQGVYVSDDGGTHLQADGRFTTPAGEPAQTPNHVAIRVWTAYSPAASWGVIVKEFVAAHAKMQQGDDTKMKAWTNTTLGQTWEGEIERTEADELKLRAEPYALRTMPRDCLLLLASTDTQDNRLEVGVWGYGKGGEMWPIDHHVIFGNPANEDVWLDLEDYLFGTEFQHPSGQPQKIYASAIDSGGHHADAVYAFAFKHRSRRVHAIKGASAKERSIDNGNSKVSFDWRGRRQKHGPTLWIVGTNLAKDRFHARLDVKAPGPGYVHFSQDLTDEWFRQLTGEDRATRRGQYGTETRWIPNRKRLEVRDCMAYTVFLEERLNLWAPRKKTFWDLLENMLNQDVPSSHQPAPTTQAEAPAQSAAYTPPIPTRRRGRRVYGAR